MSEYQYYEFQTLDTPLNSKQMEELRGISTRARITSTSFINHYNFGSGLKARPTSLMDNYFDAHFYFANWGTKNFCFRIPRDAVDLLSVERYDGYSSLNIRANETHVHFEFSVSPEDPENWGDYCGEDGEGGTLTTLISIRNDIIAGDYRSLYFAWLHSVENGDAGEDEEEPPVPSGLKDLTPGLFALTELLGLSPDILTVAAEVSPSLKETDPKELQQWINSLARQEKDTLLFEAVTKRRNNIGTQLFTRFLKERGSIQSKKSDQSRTAKDIFTKAAQIKERRLIQEKLEKEAERLRREKEAAEKRSAYLQKLRGEVAETWKKIESLTRNSKPSEYAMAVSLLKDLRDLAQQDGKSGLFSSELRLFSEKNQKKGALARRIKEAGLV